MSLILIETPNDYHHRIGGIMVSVLGTPNVVDRGFTPRSGQTKHYEIRMCCFSAKHTLLRRNNKDWFQHWLI
jgi:hypothetical protein